MVQDGDSTSKGARPDAAAGTRFDGVPLFPLAEMVHFPHVVLPLHIFEPRYRAMVADALAGDRLIAMALPRDRDEAADSAAALLVPAIHPVVCIGRIIRHERLADGRYHLLLEGQHRARVLSERPADASHKRKQYRIARLALLEESNGMEIDLERQRERMRTLFTGTTNCEQASEPFRQIIDGPTPTNKLADLMAFHLLEHARLKQAVLSDRSVPRRVSRLLDHLQTRWQPTAQSADPSMN